MIDWTQVIRDAIAGTVAVALALVSVWASYKYGYHNGRSYEAIAFTDHNLKQDNKQAAAATAKEEQTPVHGSGNPDAGGSTYEVKKVDGA